MKKFTWIVLALTLLWCGCDDPDTSNQDSDSALNASGLWNLMLVSDGTGCLPLWSSALNSTVPLSDLIDPAVGGVAGMWYSVRLNQSGPSIFGVIPEQHALTLIVSPVTPGNTMTLSFRRAADVDGVDGDFFHAVVTNGSQTPSAEYSYDTGLRDAGADSVITYAFVAESNAVMVDFIAGLSRLGESLTLDTVRLYDETSGLTVFFEEFEGLTLGSEWSARSPSWAVGDMGLSSVGALSGSNSARWNGGGKRQVTGSVIDASSALDVGSLLGGGASGLLGDADTSSLSGIFLEVWEPDLTQFLTVFALASLSPGALAGTFKGESQDHLCVETGQLTATGHQTSRATVSSQQWVMTVTGEKTNCTPALDPGDPVYFTDVLSAQSGDTIPVSQLGQFFVGGTSFDNLESITDDHGNVYNLNGVVAGDFVSFELREVGDAATANGIGAVSDSRIQGALTGSMVFDGGRVCELVPETSGFLVDLVTP